MTPIEDYYRGYLTPEEHGEMLELLWQQTPITIPQEYDDEENPDMKDE